MTLFIFYLIFIVEILSLLFVLTNLGNQTSSVWPPQERNTKTIYSLMIIFYSIVVGNIWLSIKEWDNLFLNVPGLRFVGAFFFIVGVAIYAWCRMYMSKKIEFGGKDHLITQGPYKYTRNPLYIADTLIFLGFALFSNSMLVIILMTLLVFTLLLLPLIEESWLLEQYGEKYRRYKAKVPRYIKI